MPPGWADGSVPAMQTLATDALTQLADDVMASAWLLPAEDPVRQYLSMLAALPADEEAWLEVLAPWAEEMQRGWRPAAATAEHLPAAGALAVSALRTARQLPRESPLSPVLHKAARWGFFLVRPESH